MESEVNWVAATSSSAWASPGARGLGSDRQNIVLASLLPKATGSTTVTFDTVQLSIVESWIANPATNYGFVIDNQSNTDGLGFSSAEALSASDRPRFTLTVAPP